MKNKNYNYVTQFCFSNVSINVLNYKYKKTLFGNSVSLLLSIKSSEELYCTVSVDQEPYYELKNKKDVKDIKINNTECFLNYNLKGKNGDFRLVIAPTNYDEPEAVKKITGESTNYPVIYINLKKSVIFEDKEESLEGFLYQAGRRTHNA